MSGVVSVDRIRGTLGELLPLKYGKSLPAAVRDASGSVPVFGSSGLVGKHSSALTTGPTIIVGRKGNVGAVHFSAVPCWPIDTAYFVEPPAGHSATYYRYLLTSLNLVRLDKSTAIPGLSRDDYNAVEVAIHAPARQLEIVAELEKQFSRLDEAVANLQRVKANLKRYKASVLKAAVEGRLVETEATLARHEGRTYETGEQLLQRMQGDKKVGWNGRGSFKLPVAPETAELSEVPEGWTWASIDQLAAPGSRSITDGPFGSNLKSAHYVEDGPRVIRLQNIKDGEFEDAYAHITQEHFESLRKHEVFEGDIVIASLGENPPRACIIPASVGPAIVKADCIRFKPHLALPLGYLNAALNCQPTRMRVKDVLHGIGRPRLSLGEIRAIALPIPPAAEQARIVAEVDRHLSIIREVEAEVDANLQRAQALRQATLAKAFGAK